MERPAAPAVVTGSERRALDAAEAAIAETLFRGPVYHLVRTDPPTEEDFLSLWARNLQTAQTGQPSRLVPEKGDTLHMWAGISTYDDEAAAHRTAVRYPTLGRFIARLEIPFGAPIRIEKTGTDAHHFTVWGAPRRLRECVESVRQVRA